VAYGLWPVTYPVALFFRGFGGMKFSEPAFLRQAIHSAHDLAGAAQRWSFSTVLARTRSLGFLLRGICT
jgi:hypothetical protein